MFPKHNGYDTISETFALNLIIFVPLTLAIIFIMQVKQNFFLLTVLMIFFLQLMLYHLILVYDLHQELEYFFSYYCVAKKLKSARKIITI